MSRWLQFRKLLNQLAPEHWAYAARKHVALLAVLLGLAAIAGAVVLTPSRRSLTLPSGPNVWGTVRQRVTDRAQVDLFEDFSAGLDSWQNGNNHGTSWSFDRNGFVNLGPLLLFEPSKHLRDYDLDALVQIEGKGFGIAFRAASGASYQAAKILLDSSGPTPAISLERYRVLGGQASRAVLIHYPKHFQADTLYRVHLEVRGGAFALYVQGDLIDYWADPQLPEGGVGLFCSPGERARVAWVRVSHNADSLGRICSLLSGMF
jgi:hypothetical protein